MGEVKPWQIIVMVAATVAVAASAWFTFKPNPDMPKMLDAIVMVDVNTGELFEFDVSGRKAVSVPDVNPNTKKLNLMPVHQDETGRWIMSGRVVGVLDQVADEVKIKLDRKTGVVEGLGSEVKVVR